LIFIEINLKKDLHIKELMVKYNLAHSSENRDIYSWIMSIL